MTTVTVALEALTTDSAQWQSTSDKLATSSAACTGLTLTESQLSWASAETGLLATYEEVRARVELLLSQGADETGKISRTLGHVRRIYEGSDQHAINELNNVWEPNK
jgi:hypothetical protein